jgi:nicotinate-nucleotide adenylyltransferase
LAKNLGVLGGTFNPVHYGHLAAAEEVRERLKLDRILFIPSFLPPHKHDEEMPSAAARLEMVRLAVAENAHFTVSDIEVQRGGRSYTLDTLQSLRSMHPLAGLFFITGIDSFLDIRSWYQWEKLLALSAFVVLSRPGHLFEELVKIDFMNAAARELSALDRGELDQTVVRTGAFTVHLEMIPHYDISSTDIRKRIHEGRSIKYLLPDAVENYIIKNKLYA